MSVAHAIKEQRQSINCPQPSCPPWPHQGKHSMFSRMCFMNIPLMYLSTRSDARGWPFLEGWSLSLHCHLTETVLGAARVVSNWTALIPSKNSFPGAWQSLPPSRWGDYTGSLHTHLAPSPRLAELSLNLEGWPPASCYSVGCDCVPHGLA